ncbi:MULTISPECIES: acetolactate synthase small subunit [unclassified Actinomyces]|uniref:acetolactate synthase small subunit n=1 Tax=unclassified Actinomyces TaxID=2609248 RepID=UPI000D58F6CE|nr:MULTISPECIES: acetolactate synthase small subunit [unclassified Actinomyces]RAX22919.1 acetolactate synthase small subunit [Actinomyces sp. Z3]RAX24650.1 acetolactate synthase small subunit [Actinomyces sp. Z5]
MSEKHTLSVLVENKPGVLTRVSALFTRRGFNIHSLAVGPTEHEDVSRITVIADAEGPAMEQVTKQLNKLVNVIKIVELDPDTSVGRELYLIKVRADDSNRTAVLQIVDLFRAHVVDVSPTSVVIESVGSESKVKALLDALAPHGVKEIVQSGAVAISRGPRSITDQLKEK